MTRSPPKTDTIGVDLTRRGETVGMLDTNEEESGGEAARLVTVLLVIHDDIASHDNATTAISASLRPRSRSVFSILRRGCGGPGSLCEGAQ
jgi:hypothetical protein